MSTSKEPIEPTDAELVTENVPDADDPDDSLTRDDIFHVLQCRRRRLVLKYLQEHDTPAKMTDITEKIAAIEHDTTVSALKSQERQRVYIALYQSHLPKLDKEGIIEYRQNRGIVERTELTDALDRYLDEEPSMREDDAPDHRSVAPDDADHESTGSGRRLSHTHVGGLGFVVASLVSIYANLPDTPVPSGVGIAIAAVTVFATVAAKTIDGDDGFDE